MPQGISKKRGYSLRFWTARHDTYLFCCSAFQEAADCLGSFGSAYSISPAGSIGISMKVPAISTPETLGGHLNPSCSCGNRWNFLSFSSVQECHLFSMG